MSSTLESLRFDNRNLNLATDPDTRIYSRQVPNAIFSLVEPTKLKKPVLVVKSQPALGLLGLDPAVSEGELAKYFSGNSLLPGSRPAAHCYCGHQFGSFAGQLGDGATMYLGEIINPDTGLRWELQLKGAGKTPYSRTADGRKVLRSSLREFLCSEAMYNLGVPTTRAGTCVTSASTVERDPLYDGHNIREKCTVISRIAPNFFRFGSFEIFKGIGANSDTNSSTRIGPSAGNDRLKKQLLDHVLQYFPDILAQYNVAITKSADNVPQLVCPKGAPDDLTVQVYKAFYLEVIRRTVKLVVQWQAFGFVHGVLNTDNMSIMGLTIDYGPFGFMEFFDPDFVPNGSDSSARYSYKQQPEICKWNLEKLGEALEPLLPATSAHEILDSTYDSLYKESYLAIMRDKLGLQGCSGDGSCASEVLSDKADTALVESFFDVMASTSTDFVDAFVALTEFHEQRLALVTNSSNNNERSAIDAELTMLQSDLLNQLVSRAASPEQLIESLRRKGRIHRLHMPPQQITQLTQLLQTTPPQALQDMFSGAPIDAIHDEVAGEFRKLTLLKNAGERIIELQSTTVEQKSATDRALWANWLQTIYYPRLDAQEESLEQVDKVKILTQRASAMRRTNPTIVLRNWLAQDVIEQADACDPFDDTAAVEVSTSAAVCDNGSVGTIHSDKNVTSTTLSAFVGVGTLLHLLENPFNPVYSSFRNTPNGICTVNQSSSSQSISEESMKNRYCSVPPAWAHGIVCTCSS